MGKLVGSCQKDRKIVHSKHRLSKSRCIRPLDVYLCQCSSKPSPRRSSNPLSKPSTNSARCHELCSKGSNLSNSRGGFSRLRFAHRIVCFHVLHVRRSERPPDHTLVRLAWVGWTWFINQVKVVCHFPHLAGAQLPQVADLSLHGRLVDCRARVKISPN